MFLIQFNDLTSPNFITLLNLSKSSNFSFFAP